VLHITKLILLILSASLVACSHPLDSEGKGDIVSATGTRDCLQEEMPCENLVVNDYAETYQGVPAAGYVFVGWLRCDNEINLDCIYNVPANAVRKAWGKVLPSLVALFRPIKLLLTSTADGGVVSQSASADCTGEQTCIVDGSVNNGFNDVLTAAPAEGFRFVGWDSELLDCDNSTYPCAVTSERMHAKARSDVFREYRRGGVDTSRERTVALTPMFVPLTPGGFALGVERVVNSVTKSYQHNSDVAALPGGGYVVAWASAALDEGLESGAADIYVQRFNEDGEAVGQNIRVSDDASVYRSHAGVLGLSGDRFLVSWQSHTYVTDSVDIFARVFDASGAPVSGTIGIVATDQYTDYIEPISVLKPDGGFLILWSEKFYGEFNGAHAQHFDVNGQPIGTPVSIMGFGDIYPEMAYFSDGGYVVANSREELTVIDFPVTVRCYSSEGELLQQSLAGDSPQHLSTLTVLQDDSFLITWLALDQEYEDSYGIYRKSYGVFARRFSKNCIPQGQEFIVNTSLNGDQIDSSSVAMGDGGFVIGWSDNNVDEVFAQRFDAEGERLGAETRLNNETFYYPEAYHSSVRLAELNNANVAAVWTADMKTGDGHDVHGRLLFTDTDGDLLSDEWELAYGLDPEYPYDALIDTDEDGMHNLDEFNSGSNPLIDER
jgi:List-Bact-rpt repeat protein